MRQLFIFTCLVLWCIDSHAQGERKAMGRFTELYGDQTGIDHHFGRLPHSNVEGGGVAIGDLNNDGQQDVFLAGDSLHGLYENLGGLRFAQRFASSGLPHLRGVTTVIFWDVDNDGLQDLIVGKRSSSTNFLYPKINNGKNQLNDTTSNLRVFLNKGNFRFEEPLAYRMDVRRPVTGLGIADFDRNGLMDVALTSWDLSLYNGVLKNVRNDTMSTDPVAQVFLQIQPGVFKESAVALGLVGGSSAVLTSNSLMATDLNNDGWTDLIVTNDFETPEYYFLNREGIHFEKIELGVTSYYAMGVDAADINNDGLVDVFTTDMRPDGYYRQKTLSYEKSYEWDILLHRKKGLQAKQMVKNTLHINQGGGKFSEVAEAIGADATDWSWSVLLADFDNNGHKDIFIANGFYHQDMMQLDAPLISDSIMSVKGSQSVIDRLKADTISAPYFHNYMYANEGDMRFSDWSGEWLGDHSHNTRGAAYADLDNDGDLDLVLNNAKQKSVVLQNNAVDTHGGRHLRVALTQANGQQLHSRCHIYYANGMQMQEMNPCRGFYSCSEQVFHFGLGQFQGAVDSVIVIWANGDRTIVRDVSDRTTLVVDHKKAVLHKAVVNAKADVKMVVPADSDLKFVHEENQYNDFEQNFLLPQLYSRSGPCVAVGDIDGNGLNDVVIGGSSGQSTTIFYQIASERFEMDTTFAAEDQWKEDASIAIFDINKDGLNDIFVAVGGNEEPDASDFYVHRYYLNQGGGKLSKFNTGVRSSASVVKVGTIDSLQVVFIGGRVKPWNYPFTPASFLLTFKNGKWFTDVTDQFAPGLKSIGMVTDATWTDFNGDGHLDLIVVGEYMAPQFFAYDNGKLKNVSDRIQGLEGSSGFWTSIAEGDFNKDGKMDFVFGNLGQNTRYKPVSDGPLEIFANDFDGNGTMDIITAVSHQGKVYPTKQLNALRMRIGGLAKKYYRYSSFAKATVQDMFGDEMLKSGFHRVAHTTTSVYCENRGNLEFKVTPLPFWAQVAPIMDMKVMDMDADGNADILVVGNFFTPEVERGRYTAQKGLILKGNGKGGFETILSGRSGFETEGDCRFVEVVNTAAKGPLILVGRNSQAMKVFKMNSKRKD